MAWDLGTSHSIVVMGFLLCCLLWTCVLQGQELVWIITVSQHPTQGLGAQPVVAGYISRDWGQVSQALLWLGLRTCKAQKWVHLELWDSGPFTSSHSLLTFPRMKWGSCSVTLLSLRQGLNGQSRKAAASWQGAGWSHTHWYEQLYLLWKPFQVNQSILPLGGREGGRRNWAQGTGLKWDL